MKILSMLSSRVLVVSLIAAGVLSSASPVYAQPLGAFRWQMQPFCNVVTLTIVQEESSLLLTGNDDLCGTASPAPATGTAVVNADRSVTMGVVVITSTGAAVHLDATFGAAGSGTWRDADGHAGPLLFDPAAPAGQPRPAPTTSAVITAAQLAPAIFSGSGAAATLARSDHTHDDRYYTKAQADAIVGAAGADVVDGPGFHVPAVLNVQNTQSFITETVVTPKAGRLLIGKSFKGSINCTPVPGVLFFLILDSEPVRTSVAFTDSAFQGQLSGVTTGVVDAGPHTIGVGAQCAAAGAFPGSGTTTAVTISSVVVFP
jgi:hypothetical protein